MKRSITAKLEGWANKAGRKPLIINGARQIGKSWVVRNLGATLFKGNYCEINFEKNPLLAEIFTKDFDVKRIVQELEIACNISITRETLIFFDEIQEFPRAIMALRYFYEDLPEQPVIATGSLLGFQLKEISFPVGRVQLLDMHPMTFAEFLLATNNDVLLNKIQEPKQALSDFVEAKIYTELLNYFWVGGMPECVQDFATHKNYRQVRNIQSDLLQTFMQDFSKYNPLVNKDCLVDILKNVTTSVGSQIIYTKLSDRFTGATIKKGVDVLSTAHLLQSIPNVSIASLPLVTKGRQFKLQFLDIGLLLSLSNVPYENLFFNTNLSAVLNGAWAEQYVAQQLIATKYKQLSYWARSKASSNAEVDYVIEENGQIIPIEIKSGTAGKLRSLHVLLAEYPHIQQAHIYSKAPIGVLDKLHFIPIYYAGM